MVSMFADFQSFSDFGVFLQVLWAPLQKNSKIDSGNNLLNRRRHIKKEEYIKGMNRKMILVH